jgi:hypothetical protein
MCPAKNYLTSLANCHKKGVKLFIKVQKMYKKQGNFFRELGVRESLLSPKRSAFF